MVCMKVELLTMEVWVSLTVNESPPVLASSSNGGDV